MPPKTAKKKAPAKKAAKKKVAAKNAPKKKPAKKTTAKKAAKKKKKKVLNTRLEDPDKLKPIVFKKRMPDTKTGREKVRSKMVENVRKSIDVVSDRSKTRPVKLLTPAMLRRELVPYEEIYFQFAIDSIGLRAGSVIEIIAAEHVGKTTFCMDFISRLQDFGCYSIYCEGENKMMKDRQIKRCMDRDPKVAVQKMNSTIFTEVRTLVEFDHVMRVTLRDLRKRCNGDPETKGNPIFVFCDPWTALMSESEAKGHSDFGNDPSKKAKSDEQPKDAMDGSNFEHAKHASRTARTLPSDLKKYNATLVLVKGQNDKIDMQGNRPSYLPPESPLDNDTTLGGRAHKRVAGYRITLQRLGDIREKAGQKRVYGHKVRAKFIKNSYGPRARTCEFSVLFDNYDDRPDYQAPAMCWAERTCAWMASNKYLGVTVDKELYTCDALGCVAVPPEELYAALQANPEELEALGGRLGIEGYSTPILAKEEAAQRSEDADPPPVVPGDAPPVVPADEEPPPVVPGDDAPPVVPADEPAEAK